MKVFPASAADKSKSRESRNLSITTSVSEVGDADMAEAIMNYQSAEALYQASLVMASNIFQMSLVNYL